MSKTLKAGLISAVLRVLEPLVSLLLEAGVGLGEFHELAKRTYVRVARDRVAEDRPNISRIALLTGLTRRDVGALLVEPEGAEPVADYGHHRAEQVLKGWWSDPSYLDDDGRPRRLAVRGKRRSFATLVKRYSGDPRPRTILEELIRVKAVRQHPDGRLEALSRTVATARWDAQGVVAIGDRVPELLDTMLYNIKHPSRPRYERLVVSDQVDPRYVPLLLRDITQQADAWADSFQDSLNDPSHTVHPGRLAQDARRLGVAIYVVEDDRIVDPTKGTPKPLRKPN